MMKVLIIVTERLSANGICALSVAKAMVNRGDEVCCIVNREYGDTAMFEQNGILFYTVRPRLVYTISSLLLRGKGLSQTKQRVYSFIKWVINKTELFFSLHSWPVISSRYSRRIYNCIKEVNMKRSFDMIIPVYTQIDTLIAANKFKKLFNNNVVVVPYFLDSLAAGYGPKIMSQKWVEKRGLKWENRLLREVNHIVMMKSSEPFYEDRRKTIPYFSKISFLDLPLFVPSTHYKKKKNSVKEILYVGTIPGHIRNPKFFLEIFTRINDDGIQLTLIGPSTCESMIQEYVNKDHRIKRIQSVPHNEAIKRIESADILLNLGNNLMTMTPSKIFEYISTGKPIISTAPIKDEPCIPYLERYGNACIIYEDKEVDESVALATKFIACSHNVNPLDLDEVFYLNQPKAFLEVLDKTIQS